MNSIYMRYTELRDAKNVTNNAVSKATGISNGSFDAWKKGSYYPSMKNLIKLADYFQVSVNEFLKE